MRASISVAIAGLLCFSTYVSAQPNKEELQERCGKLAAEVFAKEWGTGTSNTDYGQTIADYRNHYNFRLNKCFYLELSATYPRRIGEGQFSSSRLFDLQESKEIGTYQQLEDEVVSCGVQGKECHGLSEYQTLIKPFMED